MRIKPSDTEATRVTMLEAISRGYFGDVIGIEVTGTIQVSEGETLDDALDRALRTGDAKFIRKGSE